MLGWLSQWATLDLQVVSSDPTLGIETNLKKKNEGLGPLDPSWESTGEPPSFQPQDGAQEVEVEPRELEEPCPEGSWCCDGS